MSKLNADMAREALIRLLANAAADGEGCDGDCQEDGDDPFPICMGMRALGWGQHFTVEEFDKHAYAALRTLDA